MTCSFRLSFILDEKSRIGRWYNCQRSLAMRFSISCPSLCCRIRFPRLGFNIIRPASTVSMTVMHEYDLYSLARQGRPVCPITWRIYKYNNFPVLKMIYPDNYIDCSLFHYIQPVSKICWLYFKVLKLRNQSLRGFTNNVAKSRQVWYMSLNTRFSLTWSARCSLKFRLNILQAFIFPYLAWKFGQIIWNIELFSSINQSVSSVGLRHFNLAFHPTQLECRLCELYIYIEFTIVHEIFASGLLLREK